MTDTKTQIEPLPWTGERYLPDIRGNIELEHLHRYLFASRLALGKRVLDIASGEGYGSSLLAQRALSVVGVDIAAEAVAHANASYRAENLEFKIGSCAAIPLPDHCVDVVVSFETIEHHYEHEEMMREIKRVLVPGGLLVISSPDKFEYSEKPGGHVNPYHVKELYRGEFKSLLNKYFKHHHIAGQRVIYGSAIFDEDSCGTIRSYDLNDKKLLPAPGIARALYLVAVASDAELPQPESGVLEQPVGESDDVRDGIRQIRSLHQTVGERDAQIAQLNQAMAERDEKIAEYTRTIADRDSQIALLHDSVSERDRLNADQLLNIAELHEHIGQLQQAVTVNEVQLAHWNRAVTERDERISRLLGSVSEKEEKIAQLIRTATASDGKIAHLHQTVADHDGQILGLGQDLAESHGQVVSLQNQADRIAIGKDAEIDHVRQQLKRILLSRSWRATAPLRKITTMIRETMQSSRTSFFGRITAYFRIRSDIFFGPTIHRVRDSSLFNAEYYLAHNPDLRDAGVDPARHYLLHGWREHRDPSAAFGTAQYLLENPDVEQAGLNPLAHYLRFGRQEGRRIAPPGSVLDTTSYPGAVPPQPVQQRDSAGENQPSFAFEGAPFGAGSSTPEIRNREGAGATIDAEVEAIRKSGLFDEPFYLSMYADLQLAPGEAIKHYCEHGWHEGKNPSNDFDTRFYVFAYSDIRNAGINPFWHYVVAGASESRQALPEPSARYEDDIWFGDFHSDIKLLAFYSSPDWTRVRGGRPLFRDHPQPLFPHDQLGFYDAADAQVLESQARMAKHHGLYGFCFHFQPDTYSAASFQTVDLFMAREAIDFPFCVQTKLDRESVPEELVAGIARVVSDCRYIHLKKRPVIIVSVTSDTQSGASLVGDLRRRIIEHGAANPFIIGLAASAREDLYSATSTDWYDALLDLPGALIPGETGDFKPLDRNGVEVVPYSVVASQGVTRTRAAQGSAQPLFHCVSLGRDNTASNPGRAIVYTRFHMADYRRWLDAAIAGAKAAHPEDRRFVFVNAWNNWNEGLFLEPDRQGGFCRLNETTRALVGIAPGLQMPKVSVIVPNFNHERFLRRRLNSIYGQTYKNIEVILMDDCSSDGSRSVLDQYAAANPEITRTVYNQRNSGGAFRQWAKGIQAATGDLVWIAESDDFCDEKFLEVLVRCFDDEAVMLAYSKCVFVAANETPLPNEFQIYVSDLKCAAKWDESYVETAHNEVRDALGIKNTIPNASGVLFKRPVDMPLLDNEAWRSMVVAGDWVFYLHILRGGKIAYASETTNYFRRYEGSAAEVTYKKEVFYREVGFASQTVAALYKAPLEVLEQCRNSFYRFYEKMVGQSDDQFAHWYDFPAILHARESRLPNVLISTMGFFPGGAEILPIRLANEFKRQGLSVLLLSAGLAVQDNSIRRMLRNDVPLVVMSDVAAVKTIIHEFGIEVLNTHQWHIQKYPLQVPDVFGELRGHVASLHGMIEHKDAFGVTEEQLREADRSVTKWVYTAEKNLGPFSRVGLYDASSSRFVKIPNGMQAPRVVPIFRADIGIPEEAFALCCVSRAIPDKGWAEAIAVVNRARALSGRDIRLILVGNGAVYDEYCQTGVPDFVYLAGFSGNSVGHYAAADMGIMLTKFKSESFPLTIVDCLFAGKPYIATDVGDIRNMLTTLDGVAGAVIELEDWEIPIERAAKVVAAFAGDRKKYEDALTLVPDVANRYRIDNVAAQYIRLFSSSAGENEIRRSGYEN